MFGKMKPKKMMMPPKKFGGKQAAPFGKGQSLNPFAKEPKTKSLIGRLTGK